MLFCKREIKAFCEERQRDERKLRPSQKRLYWWMGVRSASLERMELKS